jgi:hypothetical protein
MAASRQKRKEGKAPDLPPERALPEFERQLAALQNFKDRNAIEARSHFEEWRHYTQILIEKTFGDQSSNLSAFYRVLQRGEHNIMGIPPYVQQRNLERFVEGYELLLNSIIKELRLMMPEAEIKGAYEPGQEFEIYRDLKKLIQSAKGEILLIDNYVDRELFELYVDGVDHSVLIRLLTANISASRQSRRSTQRVIQAFIFL